MTALVRRGMTDSARVISARRRTMMGQSWQVRGMNSGRKIVLAAGAACLLCFTAAGPLGAQDSVDEMQSMREEMLRQCNELNALKDEVRQLKSTGATSPIASSSPVTPPQQSSTQPAAATPQGPVAEEQPSPAEVLPLLQAQVAEQAQTKVESNSKFPVRLFGMMVSNTFFNSGEATWLENPILVPPAPTNGPPSGSFSSTLR
jgi:hypothetical protein